MVMTIMGMVEGSRSATLAVSFWKSTRVILVVFTRNVNEVFFVMV